MMKLKLCETEAMNPQSHITDEYFELKSKLHNRLIDLIDLSMIGTLDQESLKMQINSIVQRLIRDEGRELPLNLNEKNRLIKEIEDEVLGLGPLEPFLQDSSVSDILINSYNQIYVERYGKLQPTDSRFKDNEHLMKIIDKIVSSMGRRIDEASPMVDARLEDGSRVNVIIPPLAIDGPSMSIRRFSVEPLQLKDLIMFKTLTPEIGELLKGVVQCRQNILISGGTGSGKTTLLNVLSQYIPSDERIVTIEDAAELQLKQEHVVRLETRPPNIEGQGEITQRDLVKNCLRMRPDRIILGEVRGEEAFDMLQAMNTGHDGSLTTIHANSSRDALMRLESMVAMTGMEISPLFMRRFISSAIDVVIQQNRLTDGSRKVISLQEVTGMEGDIITLQEIFSFQQDGVSEDGKVKGRFTFSGVRPKFLERFKALGIEVPNNIFRSNHSIEV